MKFFTYKELQAGIPTKDDITEAGKEVRYLFLNNFATDALVYGSLAKGTHNERSDLDMIAIVPDGEYYAALLRNAHIAFANIHSAISTKNVLIIPQSITETQLNFLPSYLIENIRIYHQDIVGDVFSKITPSNISPEEACLGYLQQKTRKCLIVLAHERNMNGESIVDALDSVFCAPKHIIRNFIFLLDRVAVEPESFEAWTLENIKPFTAAQRMVGLMKSMQDENREYARYINQWNTYFITHKKYDIDCRYLLHTGTHTLLEFLKEAYIAYQHFVVKK